MKASALAGDVLDFVHDARVLAFSLNISGNITVWNRQISSLTGYSNEEIVGSLFKVKPMFSGFHHDLLIFRSEACRIYFQKIHKVLSKVCFEIVSVDTNV